MITAEKIWAAHCNEARRTQLLDSDAELEYEDRQPPSPRAYIKVKTPWRDYLLAFQIRKYLP